MFSRILILRSGALGDFIVTLPVIAGLRKLCPHAWIEVLGPGGAAALAEGLADNAADLASRGLHELFLPHNPDAAAGPAPGGTTSHYIKSFDLVISWLGEDFFANVSRLASGTVVNVPPVPPAGRSAALTFFDSIPQLRGLPFKPPRVKPTSAEERQAAKLLARNGLTPALPLVAVHPGSGGRRKCWPPRHFAAVIRALLRAGRQVAIISGEADAEAVAGVGRELALPGLSRPAILADLPVRLLAAVLAACGAYLGNDSGVSHLAAAAGTKCFVIFGPTDPVRWAPAGENVTVICADLPCRPCGQTAADCPRDLRCLTDLLPDDVISRMAC